MAESEDLTEHDISSELLTESSRGDPSSEPSTSPAPGSDDMESELDSHPSPMLLQGAYNVTGTSAHGSDPSSSSMLQSSGNEYASSDAYESDAGISVGAGVPPVGAGVPSTELPSQSSSAPQEDVQMDLDASEEMQPDLDGGREVGWDYQSDCDVLEDERDSSEDEPTQNIYIARPNAAHIRQHLNRPLYPKDANNSDPVITVVAILSDLRLKLDHGIPDVAFDGWIKLKHQQFPGKNLYPRSLRIMLSVLGYHDLTPLTRHACCGVSCTHVFEPVPKPQWRADEECPLCKQLRFERVSGSKLQPRRPFYDFGLESQLQSLLDDALVWPMVHKGYEEPGYFSSTEWGRLKSQVNVGEGSLLPVELGLDWGQPFEYRNHSVGIITLRIHSLPLQHRAKRRFGRVLMIIAGPQEPASMDAYMNEIVTKLLEYGPGQPGDPEGPGLIMKVRQRQHDSVQHVKVYPVLTGIHGDAPAIKKLNKSLMWMNTLCCHYCLLHGARINNTIRLLGYSTLASQGARRLGQDGKDIADPAFPPGSVGVNIEKLSAAEQRQRAELVGEPAQRERAVCFGVTGQSQLYRLPYVDANNVWLFAPSHTAVLGPLKDFWRHLLEAWTREGDPPVWRLPAISKQILKARAAHIRATIDMPYPYRDLIAHHRQYTISEWRWFLEYSPVILAPYVDRSGQEVHILHTQQLRELWSHMRPAFLHYTTNTDETNHKQQQQEDTHTHMLDYARLAEQYLGPTVMTFKLHSIVCRFLDQERARGPMVCESELFVERAIQDAKSSCKYRARAFPEPVIGKYCLLKQQELAMRAKWAGRFPVLLEPAREQVLHGASSQCLDEPAAADAFSSHMIGSGKQPDSTQLRALQVSLQQAYTLQAPTPDSFLHAWRAAETGVKFEVYQRATLRGSEIVHAEAYQQSDKTSHFCLVWYEEEAQPGGLMERPYAAHIKWFVKVTLTSQQLNTDPRTERFAIADTLPLQQQEYYGGSCFVHNLSTPQLVPQPNGVNYPIPLKELRRKLVWCPYNNVITRNVPRPEHWLFTQYYHIKSYVDAESAAEF